MNTRIRPSSLLAVCALLSACLFVAARAAAEEPPVRIGFVGDFSEVSKSYTDHMLVAAQLAVDMFNAEGGVDGRSVELLVRDGGNDPERHAALVTELVRERGAVAIFGGASTPPTLMASAACRALKVPYLVSIGNSQSIVVENGHPWVFQFQATVPMETKAFSIFATLMPWRRYAWIGPDYSWGHGVLDGFKRQFGAIGTPLVWTAEVWHPLGCTDFRQYIQRIRDGRPDALVIGTFGEDALHFVTQAQEGDLFRTLAVFGWFTYDMAGQLGRLVPEGMWSLARGGPFNYLAARYPLAERFVADFHERSGTYPDGYTIACFDSLLAWRAAARAAGTTAPDAVARSLKGLRFESLRGERTIRPIDGQMDCPIYFGRLVHGASYPFAVWESVVEIPASKIWLSEDEVRRARAR